MNLVFTWKHIKSEAKYIQEHCIICQKNAKTTSFESGRYNLIEAANIRDDNTVLERMKMTGYNTFVYHMTKNCFKTYTMEKPFE